MKFIQAGYDFAVAISRENKLFIWGKDYYYNLGRGLSERLNSVRPPHLLPTYQFTSACAGRFHGAAVTTTGKVFTWGTNTQLGFMTCAGSSIMCSETNCSCPQSSYPLTSTGEVYAWVTTRRDS